MSKKRNVIVKMVGVLLAAICCFQFISCKPKARTVVRFWHTYTGDQARAFRKLVSEYNRTEGAERGVEIVAYYKGTLSQLSEALNSVDKSELPNIIEVTDESAYLAYLNGRIVSAEEYLSAEDLSGYVSGFLSKGRFTADGDTYIFPMQANVDVLYINGNIFNEFKTDYPNVRMEQLRTWEDLYGVAAAYYNWSGKSFLAIDSLSDYIMTVADQYASPIVQKGNKGVQIVLNEDVLRHIWNFYYCGTLRGYISSSESSVNYQMEAGQVVCYLAASSEANRVPLSYRNDAGIEKTLSLFVRQYPSVNPAQSVIPSHVSGVAVVDTESSLNSEAYHFLNWLAQSGSAYKFNAVYTNLPVHTNVLRNTQAYEDLLTYVSDLNPSVFVTYSEVYGQLAAQNVYNTPIFYGSTDFAEEISRSLLNATREGKMQMEILMSEGASYEEALRVVEQETYFLSWLETLEQIRNKY